MWTSDFIETHLTWNDDGIRLPGEGNAAFQNTLHAFGDSFAVADGVFSAAVHFYRNKITMTGDDAFEGDYGTRNLSFYDNHITNSAIFLSLDPLWGGPLYCFRNVSINTIRGPFKLNNTNSGFLIYNNTVLRTQGRHNWGWVQFNDGALRNWAYRNNILIYQGAGGLMAIESTGNEPIDFTHNAWYPDGSIWWTNSGGSFPTLSDTKADIADTSPVFSDTSRRHEGDIISDSNPFTVAVSLGADFKTEVTTFYTPTVANGSNLQNAGVQIPGITDGYSGAAPTIGALIDGRAVSTWGAVD
jgi:hypothetical protein